MKRVLDADEVEQLLSTFTKAPTSIRNRALVVVLWRTGLRISEALALRLSDLDRKGGCLHVHKGKGGKTRIVAMAPSAWDALDDWLRVRKQQQVRTGSPIFCTLRSGVAGRHTTKKGEPLSPQYAGQVLKRKASQAGIDPTRVHPHALRHAFAVEMVKRGKPVEHLRQLLGHANLAVTSHYLARINPEEALASARSLDDGDLADDTTKIERLERQVAALAARLDQAA